MELVPGVRATPARFADLLEHVMELYVEGPGYAVIVGNSTAEDPKHAILLEVDMASGTRRLHLTVNAPHDMDGPGFLASTSIFEERYPWTPDGMAGAISDAKTAVADDKLRVQCPECAVKMTASGMPKCLDCTLQAVLEMPRATPFLELIPGTRASLKLLNTILATVRDDAPLAIGGGTGRTFKRGIVLTAETVDGTKRLHLVVKAAFNKNAHYGPNSSPTIYEERYPWTPDGMAKAICDARDTIIADKLCVLCPDCEGGPALRRRTARGMPKCINCMWDAIFDL